MSAPACRRPTIRQRGALTTLVLFASLMTACNSGKAKTISPGKATTADSADQVVFGSRTLITDAGLKRAEIRSDTAFFFDENTRVEMRVVQGIFFNSQGAQDAVLTSRSGMYNTRTGMLEARGDVVINSLDGRKLATPFVRFDQRLNKISSDSAFVLSEPGKEYRGVGFVSDPDMQNIQITHVKQAKVGAVALPNK